MAFLLRNTGSLFFSRVTKSSNNFTLNRQNTFTSVSGVANFATDAPTTKRRRRSSSDDKPKRPGSSYNGFVTEEFPRLKQQDPDITFNNASKKLSIQWKGMSDNDKKKYVASFNQRAQKYEKDLAAYEKIHPKPPTKPASSFFLYVAQQRKENPNTPMLEVSKLAGEKWNKLSDSEKKKYVMEYERNKQKFEIEKKSWEQKYGTKDTEATKPKRAKM
jgi:predicted Fe-S protein YdhL (DUF1289 family)